MSDPFVNYDQPQEWDRRAYKFVWKDKTGIYQEKIVYALDVKRAELKFQEQFGKEFGINIEVDDISIVRLSLHDS